ncbi:MAG TPA: endolytic transglycosylase MltG, partial [Candidatus Sulfopaludibacter sp.]|nr:endolytic transglycosylase MltG [Candidatus Sulfopaludibacter sp.]
MKTTRRLGCLILIAILGGAFLLYRLISPYQGFSGEVFVDVPRGTATGALADLLASHGVVRSRWDFLLARFVERTRKPQAGEYKFSREASPIDVFERIARGDVFYYSLVVPEGRNLFDIAAEVEKLGLGPAKRFLEAARDPGMIRDLDPRAPSLEGYLFPDTYKLSRHATPESICRTMTGKFREVWRGLNTRADVHQTVTLAAMVEKEGKLPEERPMIAAVFENRLRIGMKLDCDPTTIYAALLAGRYRGAIYRSDLDSDHPYNTYRHAGLPPGPIANPGLASIHAVLHPAATEAIYFVLRPDGTGAHEFSRNIAAHTAAIERYRNG